MSSQAVQDYLKTIYALSITGRPVTTGEIAERLGVAPPSATNMAKRLARLGLIRHVPYHAVDLTPAALAVVRRHRLLELYLERMLGVGIEHVHRRQNAWNTRSPRPWRRGWMRFSVIPLSTLMASRSRSGKNHRGRAPRQNSAGMPRSALTAGRSRGPAPGRAHTGLALLLVALVLAGCARSAGQTPGRGARAVATYSVIADLARQVAGDRAQVSSLVPPGTDPHTYEPRPDDLRRVAEAHLVFSNGLNLELWFDRLIQGSGARARTIVTSRGVIPIVIQDPLSRYRGAPDPHAWMDVQNIMRFYVPNIRDALTAVDPGGAEVYRRNAERYIGELEALDAWIHERVATLPVPRRKLVTTENAMHYFAARYGFQVIGWIYTLAPESEPPARRIADLVERIRRERVPAFFVDLTLNPKLMERLSQETGVPIRGALYIDSLGRPGSGADSYVGMMRANVEILITGLGRPGL